MSSNPFTFNVGGPAYCRSTLARKLNAGDCYGAALEFYRWDKAKGRREEAAMFMKGCQR